MNTSSASIPRSSVWPSFLRDGLRDLWHPPANQIPALDALRATAIVMVVTGHFPDLGKAQFPRYAQLFENPVFSFGWTGVDLFFVLSGYLIGRQLWKERQRTGKINVGRFLLRRGLRIWPLYVFIALISPLLVSKWSYKWSDWVFLSNYVPGRVDGGWSLSTEEQFYLLAPLAVLFCSRFLKLRGWIVGLVSCLAAVSFVRWWTARGMLATGMSVAAVKTDMYTPFHLHNEGLTVGLLIALLSVRAPNFFDGSRASRTRVFALAGAATVLALLLRAENGVVFPFLALGLVYGSAVAILLSISVTHSNLFRSRLLYIISRLSYGMYLLHFAVLRSISPFVAHALKFVGGQNPLTVVLTLVATITFAALLATVTFVTIEHPFLRMRDRVLAHLPTASVASSLGAPLRAQTGAFALDAERAQEPERLPAD